MSDNPEEDDNCGRKTARIFKDCIADPVYKKPGFTDGLCRDYSPERPEDLEPKNMYEVGTYAYSKLQLPPLTTKMSGANGGYSSEPDMSTGAASTITTSLTAQQAPAAAAAAPSTAGQSGGEGVSSQDLLGEDRVNYGTFDKPDYKGKGH